MVYVAADEDILLRRLIGQRIGHGVIAAVIFDLRVLQQAAPFDGLTDGEHDVIRRERDRLVFVVDRREFARLRVDGAQALFEHDRRHMAVFVFKKLLRAPAGADLDALLLGLRDLVCGGGHGLARFQTDHRDLRRAEAHCRARAVHGDVAAADHHDASLHALRFICQHLVQEMHRDVGTLCILAGNAGEASALTADGNIERQIALLAQLRDGHIPADLDTAAEFHAQLTQDLNFRVDDILFQLERRDAVGHHAARTRRLFKDRRLIAARGQIVGRGQARRACADDGDLLLPAGQTAGRHDDGRDIARFRVKILLGEEFLDRVDGDGLIDGPARAGLLAAPVADAAADGREGIVLLDERQRLLIFSLRGQLQIALYGDMRRAGRLARRGALVVAVFAVVVAVVGIPVLLAPLEAVRQLVLRIFHGVSVLVAELLAKAYRARRAVFHALAAGDALCAVNLRRIGAAGKIRRVE